MEVRHVRYETHFVRALLLTLLSIAATWSTVTHAQVIGRTSGSAGVSANGTASYSIDLWTPPGAGGLRPQLALTYAHTADNGIAGVGWRVSGFSVIARCPKTIAQDSVDAAPQLLASDAYCLDGNRLRLESGTYGVAGSTYRTEIETYARITMSGTAGNGPASFEVRTADGLIYEYGATSDSRILTVGSATARLWAVSSVRDRAGNRVAFSYINDVANGSYRPDEINYAANVNAGLSSPPYQVKFIYESAQRPDPEYGYAFGSATVDGRINEFFRLDRIEVRHLGSAVRIYDLAYQAGGGAGGRSRLQSVTECSTSLADCLTPTTFTWTNAVASLQAESAVGGGNNQLVMDIDGDGRDDLVYPSAGAWRIRFSTGSTFGPEVVTGVSDVNAAEALPIEWDGDGRGDILVPLAGGTWGVLQSSGSGLHAPINTGIPRNTWDHYWAADLNGDGRDDFLRMGASTELYVRYRDASGFSATETLLTSLNGGLAGNPFGTVANSLRTLSRRVDFDGDGREDVFLNYMVIEWIGDYEYQIQYDYGAPVLASGAWHYGLFYGMTPSSPRFFGDFNGDGLTDLVTAYGSTFSLWFSNGRYFVLGSTGTIGTASYGIGAGLVLDFDGDGRDDLLMPASASGTWHVIRGTGSGLGAPTDTGVPASTARPYVAEVNGDGFADLVYVDSVAGPVRLRLHNGTPSDLLATATDGFGVAASFTYSPLTDPVVYTKGSGAAYPTVDVRPPALVVRQLTRTDGTGNGSTFATTYSYTGARVDLHGRGFLGFATRTVIDGSAGHNSRRVESYLQDFPFVGAPLSVELQQANGTRIALTQNTWSSLSWGSGGTHRRFPYVASTTVQEREVGGANDGTHFRTVTTTVAGSGGIDTTSGLILDATTTVTEVATGIATGSSRSERVLHTGVFNDLTNWCLGRPQATQVTASHTLTFGAAITRSSDATWDGLQCRLTQQRLEPGSSQWQVTVGLAYDAFGNVSARTVTGAGMAARATTMNWGSRGQHPESVTNALSQTSSQAWNYALALPASVTDPNGLTISWQYDGFGRQTLESRPDSTSTVRSRLNCVGCDARVRYREQVQHRNTTATVFRTDEVQVDAFDRPVFVIEQRPGGGFAIAERYTRDARGRVTQLFAPYWSGSTHNGWRQLAYDALNRVTTDQLYTSAGALERTTSTVHNGLGATTTDPRSNSTTRVVSGWGDLLRVTDPAGSTNHLYDPFGHLRRVTDALGNVSAEVGYNVRGMRTSLADMNLGTWSFTPNALGEVIGQTDAKGQTTSFAYDALGRLTSRTEPEGTSTWTWGTSAAAKNIGQLQSLAGPGYAESWSYDSLGRPVTRAINVGSVFEYAYGYNDQGNLHTLTWPTSTAGVRFKVKYGYSYGHVASVRNFTGDVDGTVFWSQTATDARGLAIDESYGNGLRVITGFSPLTGLIDYRQSGTGGSTTNVQNLTYEFDNANNLVRREDQRQGPLIERFYYDGLNRLDYSTLNGTTNLDVTLDAIGNVTWRSDVGGYSYHATKKHAVVDAGGVSYGYDANGNMTSRGGASISWTSYNLPLTVNGSGQSSTFSYAPDRSRWQQVATYAGGNETTLYVGGLLERLATSTRTHWRHMIPTPSGMVQHVRRSDGTNDTFYVTTDHLGSSDAILDAAGTVLVRPSFAAFGARRGSAWTGTPTGADLSQIANATRRGFTEHEHLDNVGLVHMNGRVYDPRTGRFLSADWVADGLGAAGSFNRYGYVAGRVLSASDPTGLFKSAFGPNVSCVGCGGQQTLHDKDQLNGPWLDTMNPATNPHLPDVIVSAQRDFVLGNAATLSGAFGNAVYTSPDAAGGGAGSDGVGEFTVTEQAPAKAKLPVPSFSIAHREDWLCQYRDTVAGAAGGFVAGGAVGLFSGNLNAAIGGAVGGFVIGGAVGTFADQPGIVGALAGAAGGLVVHSTMGGTFLDVLGTAASAAVPPGAASVPMGAVIGAVTGAWEQSAPRRAMPLGRLGGALVGGSAGAKAAALEVITIAGVQSAFDRFFDCR